MSQLFQQNLRALKCPLNLATPKTAVMALAMVVVLSGCSSIQAPSALKNLSLGKMSIPGIPANEASFRPRIYAGGAIGQSTLNPDTSETVFTVSEKKSGASEFRIGMDLHNTLSVELNTSILGKADIAEGEQTDVSFTGASINALVYGLTSSRNRSMRQGLNAYGRVGYGMVKHGSIIQPLDFAENSVILGIGAEYGFRNGIAARAEVTRLADDAMVVGIGGVFRFGLAPAAVGRIFANAAAPALGAAHTRTEVINGKVVVVGNRDSSNEIGRTNSGADTTGLFQSPAQMLASSTKATIEDSDGDGVPNEHDQCKTSPSNTVINSIGCGLFDVVLHGVTFKKGSTWLTPKARGQLDSVASTLLALPEARVEVRAHTDSDGSEESNMRLSTLRAESVVEYLTKNGVNPAQLETLGLGESQPIDTNETNLGKANNRRVDLRTLANINSQPIMDEVSHEPPTMGAAHGGDQCSACDCANFCPPTYEIIE